MLHLFVAAQVAALRCRDRLDAQDGQTTAEYALVLLGAAAIAVILVAWATKTDKVTHLFDTVVEQLLKRVK